MLSIGLVGGMSWESSLVYYKLLNLGVEQRLGGLHSARTVMSSVEFHELTELQRAGRWDDVAAVLAEAARGVEAAGADLLLMCTTAFHTVADQVEAAVGIPFLHLADVVAQACTARGLTSVGLVGTSYSMEQPFFVDRLASHGLQVVVPDPERHEAIDRIIYGELVHGKVLDASRATVVGVIDELWDAGAQGVILGCTELELLVKQADCEPLVLPSTTLHVEAALDRALAE
ncbi:aspartate/glutamate racemase family protein [Nocardioides panacis]|uniref:Aspartate/glutamate racemase family protein n=1 Tax=Nocardioides panacis TaxID=2849501 RepID=A0A975SYF2_9ACTN|nr:aspartate/glutamate racemase family protein [Nocardioides panacis]QWZ08146.1 aspartate/glutamate racemase family protein [Nocardioides panacis]